MKLFKKIAAIMLSIMMVLGMASVVSAEGTTTSGTSAPTKGKITINGAIAGQTYKIYKLLDLESYDKAKGLYFYKLATGWEAFFQTGAGNSYIDINANGYVTWKTGVSENNAAELAQNALAYANNSSNNISNNGNQKVEKGNNSVTFENLDLGYYLVESSVGALCGLTTTDNEVTIQEKNDAPSVEKKVLEDSDPTNTWVDSNTADIGQTVYFQTTITAQPDAKNYVLHDKLDAGLTFNGTVTVTKDGTDVGATNYTLKTSSITDGCTFEIAFTQAFCDTLTANSKIIVTYSATLNENAVQKTEHINETWLKYGDNRETTHDTTTTKTYEIPVFKYTKNGSNETPLAGAKFTLKRITEEDPIKLVKISREDAAEDVYRVAKETEAAEIKKTTEVTTPASGKFTIKGLDVDTYYLTETQQPDGYNKLSAPIKVVIDENGTITVGTATVTEVKVLNNAGSILPSTGGSGTTLIYILGAVLVLGSGVALITRKRMR